MANDANNLKKILNKNQLRKFELSLMDVLFHQKK